MRHAGKERRPTPLFLTSPKFPTKVHVAQRRPEESSFCSYNSCKFVCLELHAREEAGFPPADQQATSRGTDALTACPAGRQLIVFLSPRSLCDSCISQCWMLRLLEQACKTYLQPQLWPLDSALHLSPAAWQSIETSAFKFRV